MTQAGSQRVGLLFVHGIGEQQRWDHLRRSVLEMAELLRRVDGPASVSVVDRTEGWEPPPGERHPQGLAPITLHHRTAGRTTSFECHEVWWADLGARSGLLDAATFWLWALGQWCAPIYRELDAARLPKEKVGGREPASQLAKLPRAVAGHPWREPTARLQLLLAALAALFVACTLQLAKRLFAAVLGQTPTPTIILQYVGDVRTYESRATPGDAALSDPGHPRRVGIRRRMVAEMVAMGADESLDGWYVLAHSLGTVVAYNGLTEIGHALPNYLPRDQWDRLRPALKRDEGCLTRDDIHAMMPSRPPWLEDEDVINRPLLFARLRGFLTYGSPLDKFAALWPRITATATDRDPAKGEAPPCPFPAGCRWINLLAPADPVAGCLDQFAPELFGGALPRVENVSTPWSPAYGLSHVTYFAGFDRHREDRRANAQRLAVAGWLLNPATKVDGDRLAWLWRLIGVAIPYLAIVAALGVFTAGLLALVVEAGDALFGLRLPAAAEPTPLATLRWWMFRVVLPLALVLPLLMGLWRWVQEARLNVGLARADRRVETKPANADYWRRVELMLRRQAIGAHVTGLLALTAIGYGALVDLRGSAWPALSGYATVAAAAAALLLAIVVQTVLNRLTPSSREPAHRLDETGGVG